MLGLRVKLVKKLEKLVPSRMAHQWAMKDIMLRPEPIFYSLMVVSSFAEQFGNVTEQQYLGFRISDPFEQ